MTWHTVGLNSPLDEALEYCMGGMTEYDGYGDGIHGDGCGDGIGEGGLDDPGGGGDDQLLGVGYGWEDGDGASKK